MKVRVILFCVAWAVTCAQGQVAAPIQSMTGQFTVMRLGPPAARGALPRVQMMQDGFLVTPTPAPAPVSVEQAEQTLDPALLAISAERIKQSLLLTLGLTDDWRGRIHLVIAPARPAAAGTLLAGVREAQQWNFDLVLPSPIKPELLIRATVKALLTEMANRRAGATSAEVPDWLVAGLSARLQADTFPSLILQSQVSTFGDRVRLSGLEAVRIRLAGRAPLTFQQLSWPDEAAESEANYPLYAASSQLLLEELIQTPDGLAHLREMILKQLPAHLNWQTAFLAAYAGRFHDLLDVEKWWGLTSVSFAESGVHSQLDSADTWRQMRDALDVPVEVKLSPDATPVPAELTLQEVISQWDTTEAAPVLRRAMQDLTVLRMQCASEFAPLLDRYRTTLEEYLNDTAPESSMWASAQPVTHLAYFRRSASKDLTLLDQQLAALRPRAAIQTASAKMGAPSEPQTPRAIHPLQQ